jgi:hypothetical protein
VRPTGGSRCAGCTMGPGCSGRATSRSWVRDRYGRWNRRDWRSPPPEEEKPTPTGSRSSSITMIRRGQTCIPRSRSSLMPWRR